MIKSSARNLAMSLVASVWCVGLVLALAQTSQWPSEGPPPPLPAPEVRFPEYELRRLDNGLQVVVVAMHEQPVVNVHLLVRAGTSSDPSDKPGVAALAAQMLDQGTTSRTAQEIAGTIDYVGGLLSVGARSDFSVVDILVMNDSFDLALDLLFDMARSPAYAPAEIERQRQRLLSGMQVSYDNPEYVAGIVFGRLVYGRHPYGLPNNGTPASVQRITRQDLRAYHQTHYMPNNAVLAIVGDVTPEDAFNRVARVLGNWQRGVLPTPSPVEPPGSEVDRG